MTDRDSRRERFPLTAESVDLMRELFGEVTVLSIHEGDEKIIPKNYKSDERFTVIDGEHYLRLGKLAEVEAQRIVAINEARNVRK